MDRIGLSFQDPGAQRELLMLCPSTETGFHWTSLPHKIRMFEWCQGWALSQSCELVVLSSTFSDLR